MDQIFMLVNVLGTNMIEHDLAFYIVIASVLILLHMRIHFLKWAVKGEIRWDIYTIIQFVLILGLVYVLDQIVQIQSYPGVYVIKNLF